jgi:hypothetical protein
VLNDELISSSEFLNIRPGQASAPDVTMRLDLNLSHTLWMMPPVASKVVDCEYMVKVQLDFDNSCGCGGYSLKLPVEICNETNLLYNRLSESPKIHVEWNPTIISRLPAHKTDFLNVPISDKDNPILGNP